MDPIKFENWSHVKVFSSVAFVFCCCQYAKSENRVILVMIAWTLRNAFSGYNDLSGLPMLLGEIIFSYMQFCCNHKQSPPPPVLLGMNKHAIFQMTCYNKSIAFYARFQIAIGVLFHERGIFHSLHMKYFREQSDFIAAKGIFNDMVNRLIYRALVGLWCCIILPGTPFANME